MIKKICLIFLIMIILILNIKNMKLQKEYENTINTYNQTIFQLEQNTENLKNNYNNLINEKDNLIKEKDSLLKEKDNTINHLNTIKTQTSRSLNYSREENQQEGEWIIGIITAYCPCEKCCGKTNGITASGAKATANHTIAAPSNYPFGTKIEIENYGIYTVEDRGGAIKNNRIDIFMNSHQEALNFGKHQIRFRIVE